MKATPFTADHPFLFLIVDRGTGLILFIAASSVRAKGDRFLTLEYIAAARAFRQP